MCTDGIRGYITAVLPTAHHPPPTTPSLSSTIAAVYRRIPPQSIPHNTRRDVFLPQHPLCLPRRRRRRHPRRRLRRPPGEENNPHSPRAQPTRSLGHPSIPPIRRCQRFFDQVKKGVKESQACTLRKESRKRGECVRCPLRCPGCIASFERLTKRALLYGTTGSATVRRARGGLKICEKNWDRNLFQALKSQGQPNASPVSIVTIWPWLVRRPFNLEWYEEGMSS